jgi:hypothetical protein
MKIGDKVRFVSEVGGGRVAGFQGKNIVLVEDADGFQIPMQMADVVVVENEDYSTAHLVESKLKAAPVVEEEKEEEDDTSSDEPPAKRFCPWPGNLSDFDSDDDDTDEEDEDNEGPVGGRYSSDDEPAGSSADSGDDGDDEGSDGP